MANKIKISQKEYREALDKLEKSGRDGFGLLGGTAQIALGSAAGIMGSGMLASAAGATTFLGSTTLASILGTATLAATPVGWIIGSAIGGATIFYTVGKFIRSGAANDERRKRMKEDLKEKLASHTLNISHKDDDTQFKAVIDVLKTAEVQKKISKEYGPDSGPSPKRPANASPSP